MTRKRKVVQPLNDNSVVKQEGTELIISPEQPVLITQFEKIMSTQISMRTKEGSADRAKGLEHLGTFMEVYNRNNAVAPNIFPAMQTWRAWLKDWTIWVE